VDRKVIEVAGHLYVEAPKCRKTIYPRRTPDGYPLADKLAARIEQATAELEAGTNPLGLIFPSPTGKHWRSSNFNRNVLKRAYLAIGWRDADGNGKWTWHSLRHVFCTTALFTWKLDPTGSSAPSRRNSMTDTDPRQPGLGPLRAAAETAELAQTASGLISIDGCRLTDSEPSAPLARDIAWSMTEAGLTVHHRSGDCCHRGQ
jgi:hypothetical protein